MPGAVERLRDLRDAPPDEGPHAIVLGAADPAQPYGAAVPWPRREGAARSPSRVFGGQVVLVDGAPVLYLERGGRSLLTFPAGDGPDALKRGLSALAGWITSDRRRRSVGRARRRRAGLRVAPRAPPRRRRLPARPPRHGASGLTGVRGALLDSAT